jgi:hypothetical protein
MNMDISFDLLVKIAKLEILLYNKMDVALKLDLALLHLNVIIIWILA